MRRAMQLCLHASREPVGVRTIMTLVGRATRCDALLLGYVLLCVVGAPRCDAQTIEPPFDADYSMIELGIAAPAPCGGLAVQLDDPGALIVAGRVDGFNGVLYRRPVVRDSEGHITEFGGSAVPVVDDAGTRSIQAGVA